MATKKSAGRKPSVRRRTSTLRTKSAVGGMTKRGSAKSKKKTLMATTTRDQRRATMRAGIKARGKSIMAKRAAKRAAAKKKVATRVTPRAVKKTTPKTTSTPTRSSAPKKVRLTKKNSIGTVPVTPTKKTRTTPVKRTAGFVKKPTTASSSTKAGFVKPKTNTTASKLKKALGITGSGISGMLARRKKRRAAKRNRRISGIR